MTNLIRPFGRRARNDALLSEMFARHGATPVQPGDDAPEPTGLDRDAVAAFNRQRAHDRHMRLVPAEFATATADHPQIQDWAAAWLRDQHSCPWLLLLGDVGTGKTHAAYGALRWIADSGHPPVDWRDVEAADMFARLQPGGSPNTEAAFEDLANAPILLLDDLGTAADSAFTERTLYRLIGRRYNEQRTTIITSNIPAERFLAAVGARTNSRLRQKCMLIDFGRVDRRTAPGSAA